MSHFCLLRDPENYVAHPLDLVTNEPARAYWLDLFARHFQDTLGHASHRYGRSARKQIEAAGGEFGETIQALQREPASLPGGKLNVIELCRLRETALREHNLPDPFGHIKDRENTSSFELYPQVVHDLRLMDGDERWLQLMRGVFAGNIFDLGAPTTMLRTAETPSEGNDFLATLDGLKPRPWHVDDFDRLVEDLPESPPPKWTKAVMFIDNAGCDFILGMMPLARELALEGTQIVLAANELPTLNDLTIDETIDIVERLAGSDDDLAALLNARMIDFASTGNDIPLIDLSEVSDELNAAAEDADLVILEGMGRAIESNYDAAFAVDCLKLALIKDEQVASDIGGELYDCVCKYEPVEE